MQIGLLELKLFSSSSVRGEASQAQTAPSSACSSSSAQNVGLLGVGREREKLQCERRQQGTRREKNWMRESESNSSSSLPPNVGVELGWAQSSTRAGHRRLCWAFGHPKRTIQHQGRREQKRIMGLGALRLCTHQRSLAARQSPCSCSRRSGSTCWRARPSSGQRDGRRRGRGRRTG